ncbi:MAG TPA: hypothetical protein VF104_12065 [Burkholderiales bacterium]
MSRLRIHLERLTLALHGVAAGVADDIGPELERALAERLGRLDGEPLARSDFSLREIRLPAVEAAAAADTAALAGMVADRLVGMLAARASPGNEGGSR